MDAKQLYEVVKDWPEDAKPEDLEFAPVGVMRYSQTYDEARPTKYETWELDGEPVGSDAAILMFEASTARWLEDLGYEVETWKNDTINGPEHCVWIKGWETHRDKTKIEALSAAIKEASK